LSGGIPNLHLYYFSIDDNIFGSKLNSDSEGMIEIKAILYKSIDDAGFAYSSISYKNKFKRIIESIGQTHFYYYYKI
jgi:hypothetical protein